jgi:3-ketosteroid 9alpha-monooxygenase subunit A
MAKSEQYSLGPAAFARGWYIVAEAKELDDGPKAVRFFGQDLALYRGESGAPVLMDAYCPHMGTHLTASPSAMIVQNGEQIEGDSIRCPYHGWRFGPDGACDDIPYHDGPFPRSANIRSYLVKDVMGCVMAWYDPDGREPDYEAPSLKEWDDPSWVQWELDHLGEIDTHPIEVIDNMADVRHLGPTHGAPCEYFENEFKDHIYIQRQGGVLQSYGCMLQTTTWYTGPGILLSKQLFGDSLLYELIASTPVDEGRIKVWHAALHKSANDVATPKDIENAREAQAGVLAAFAADFSVWTHKRPALRIIQLPADGPFATGRKWFKQFHDKPENTKGYHEELNGLYHVKNMAKPEDSVRDIEEGLFD